MRTWIKNPLAAWTGTDADAGNGIVVENGAIAELVAAGAEPSIRADREFDASGLVMLPGLVNCHHHFYQTLTRAHPQALDKVLFPWLKALYPVWAGLDSDAIAAATELAVAELLLSGCSTTVDHHYLFTDAILDAIDVQVASAEKLGIRVVLTRGSMSVGESGGGLPPDRVVQDSDAILADSERVIDAYHDGRPGALTQIALAPCSPFSVSRRLMEDTAHLARRRGVLLHTHLGETHDENDYCVSRFGMRPVDYLESVGWLAEDVWLAHGIHFDDAEIERLGAARLGVSHCAHSNMALSSGQCRTRELEAAGVAVGLGVDGSASNDASNLMQEVRQAFLLQRLHYGADSISHLDALRWATSGGARVLNRDDIGTLEIGRRADVAMFDLDDLRFSGHGDPVAALVLCGAHRVRHLMIDGEWRVVDGALPGVDLDALRHRHQRAAERLAVKGT